MNKIKLKALSRIDQQTQARTIGTKVQQLVELNQWGPHSYSRDQLLDMLDKALATQRASE